MKKILLLTLLLIYSIIGYSQNENDTNKRIFFISVGYKYNNLDLNHTLTENSRGEVNKNLIILSLGRKFKLTNDLTFNIGLDLFSSFPKSISEEVSSHTGIAVTTDLKWSLLKFEELNISPGFIIGYSANKATLIDKNPEYFDFHNNSLQLNNNYIFIGPEIDFELFKKTDLPLTFVLGSEFPILSNKWKYANTSEYIIKEQKGKLYLKIKYSF